MHQGALLFLCRIFTSMYKFEPRERLSTEIVIYYTIQKSSKILTLTLLWDDNTDLSWSLTIQPVTTVPHKPPVDMGDQRCTCLYPERLDQTNKQPNSNQRGQIMPTIQQCPNQLLNRSAGPVMKMYLLTQLLHMPPRWQ